MPWGETITAIGAAIIAALTYWAGKRTNSATAKNIEAQASDRAVAIMHATMDTLHEEQALRDERCEEEIKKLRKQVHTLTCSVNSLQNQAGEVPQLRARITALENEVRRLGGDPEKVVH